MVRVWPVVATHGRAEWAVSQAGRLLAQLADNERAVFITDDDERAEVLLRRIKDERLILVPLHAQQGVDRAKRLGISLVPAGAVVCEIDDHDLAEPNLLEALREAFADPSVVTAYCDIYTRPDTDGLPVSDPVAVQQERWLDEHRAVRVKDESRYCERGNLGYGMRAYRKWAYDLAGGYPTEWWPVNDYALMCMIEQLCPGTAKHIRTPLVTVREGRGITAENEELQRSMLVRTANVALRGGFTLPWQSPAPSPAAIARTHHPERSRARRTIPKLVHFIWIGHKLPVWVEQTIHGFRMLNPGYRVLLHQNADLLIDSWRPTYDAIEGEHKWSRRADLLRLSVLWKLGGWFFDADFMHLRPLDELYRAYDNFPRGAFVTQGTPALIANGVIGAACNSDFLRLVVARVTDMVKIPGERPWDAYGPRLFTDVVNGAPDTVTIGDIDMFYPFVRDRARELFTEFQAGGFGDAQIASAFAGLRERPYMMHLSMMDDLELPAHAR